MSDAEDPKMTEQEISDYMNALVQGKITRIGLEVECLDEWKRLASNVARGNDALNQAKTEVNRLTTTLQQMHGGQATLVKILIAAEEERRNEPTKKE